MSPSKTEKGENIASYSPVGIAGTKQLHHWNGLIMALRANTMLVMIDRFSSTKTKLLSSRIAVSNLQNVFGLNSESRVG